MEEKVEKKVGHVIVGLEWEIKYMEREKIKESFLKNNLVWFGLVA